ncbi:endonuclease/exonuclease/phosphatase family protein [Fulvimarina sp. 2208YS6-2-32]|uniref:Endonuclease/exonuclease/phosphatase family protein n=1 Tax=Fulvimarina uroteuthidis TaxID=3098149 RepID=A0ABU5HYS0_9HYPH|nr:endonuclease/exonuclease/phosphatase family protein [Fulvimarina sp. 2208YS6-2-32]MDY8108131.1 endonuclease/exonuclease/phosphatase family protein [Fulvimarina sp. 2208YS6-2-32]
MTATIVLTGLAVILGLAAVIPFTRISHGIVRMCEFPRLQMVALALVGLLATPIFITDPAWLYPLLLVYCAVLVIHGYAIGQFTSIRKQQSKLYEGDPHGDNVVSVLSCNVKMSNRDYQRCLDMTRDEDADLALFMETDEGWAEGLQPLKETYPYVVSRPFDNSYGMILYSRLEFVKVDVKYLTMEKVPCFVCDVRLRNGEVIRIYCVHPEPPVPTADSSGRDAELVRVARLAQADDMPSIVFGDLNDVAWSHTTRLFQRLSQLLDPRVGRGFYNTFDARYWVLRWPLDHLFHDHHFSLVKIERCAHIHSDHYPIYFKLALTDKPSANENPEKATSDDREEAEEIENQSEDLDREAIGTDWEK